MQIRHVPPVAGSSMPSPGWASPPPFPELASGEVHLWRARLEAEDQVVAELERTLSSEERERSARFRLDAHRRAYLLGRGVLRAILARYLGADPAHLAFGTGDHGKPFLVGRDLRFNLTHSAGVALYAVAAATDVGVDVERIRDGIDHEALAARFFSPAEREQLLALPAGARRDAFFMCWTRKEAFVKALGEGLSMRLADFDVPVAPEEAGLVEVRGRPGETARWSVEPVDAGPGYAAAVAIETTVSHVRRWEWRR